MLVAVKNLPGFTKFMEELFGASIQVRNGGENIIVSMSSGLLTGVKNGLFYNLSGDRDLLKNVHNVWAEALNAVESASACTNKNEDKND